LKRDCLTRLGRSADGNTREKKNSKYPPITFF
jgi:hypothetical protein